LYGSTRSHSFISGLFKMNRSTSSQSLWYNDLQESPKLVKITTFVCWGGGWSSYLIGCDENLGIRIENSVSQRLGTESCKHHPERKIDLSVCVLEEKENVRVRCSDPCTGKLLNLKIKILKLELKIDHPTN